MDNDEIVKRKAEIKKRVIFLRERTDNPSAFTLADHTPLVGSPELKAMQEEIVKLSEEYQGLMESKTVANLTMHETLTIEGSNYTLKYRPQYGRWDFYIGEEYQRNSKIEFSEDRKSITISVPRQSSDMHGEYHFEVYLIKVIPTPEAIPFIPQKPCGMKEEGLGMIAVPNKDEAYYKSMGLIFDPIYKKWRKQTPEEYQAKEIAERKKHPLNQKKKRTLFDFFKRN